MSMANGWNSERKKIHGLGIYIQWLGIVLTVGAWTSSSLAATILVPGDYTTIQAAVDAAVDGDVVMIADGVYTGIGNRNIDFGGKKITVRSASGMPERCIINCERQGRGFYFHSGETADAIVEGLSIRNGWAGPGALGDTHGGGIFSDDCTPVIRNCVIAHCAAAVRGGGLYVSGRGPEVSYCRILNNRTYVYGGGIYAVNGNDPNDAWRISNCIIAGNYCDGTGSGLWLNSGSHVQVVNSTIINNRGQRVGLFTSGDLNRFQNCIIRDTSILVYNTNDEAAIFSYCNVEGGQPGVMNIDDDPRFAFPTDYHLMSDSPCIDTGTNTPEGGLPVIDLDAVPRSLDGDLDLVSTVDQGVYEVDPHRAVLAIEADYFVLSAPEGTTTPTTQRLKLRTVGNGAVRWRISESQPWLQASPDQGVWGDELEVVTIAVDPTGLPAGVHYGWIEINSIDGANVPLIVTVEFRVTRDRRVPSEYATIQAAIDAANTGDRVVIADGRYTGIGNRDLDFLGKAIVVRGSSEDPNRCVIDCDAQARGVRFQSNESRDSVIANLTITEGYAPDTVTTEGYSGGAGCGILCFLSQPTIRNCRIAKNGYGPILPRGGGIACVDAAALIEKCELLNNTGYYGGGLHVTGNDVTRGGTELHDCVIRNNTSERDGGGAFVNQYLVIDHCLFQGNRTTLPSGATGGAINCSKYGALDLLSSTLVDNHAGLLGGGVAGNTLRDVNIISCAIANNTANKGGGLSGAISKMIGSVIAYNHSSGNGSGYTGSTDLIANCVFAYNESPDDPEAVDVFIYTVEYWIRNSIFWSDSKYVLYNIQERKVNNCVVKDTLNYYGSDIIDADPLFVDPDGPDDDPNTWEDNDFRLLPGSPCIDAGDNLSVPRDEFDLDGDGDPNEPWPVDFDDLRRFFDDTNTPDTGLGTAPIVDIGAFEYGAQLKPGCVGDLNCDDAVDAFDIDPFIIALLQPALYEIQYPDCQRLHADADANGSINAFDIEPFIETLLAGGSGGCW